MRAHSLGPSGTASHARGGCATIKAERTRNLGLYHGYGRQETGECAKGVGGPSDKAPFDPGGPGCGRDCVARTEWDMGRGRILGRERKLVTLNLNRNRAAS